MSDQFQYRPWGYWRVIEEKPGYKIKELFVEPGMSLSKQYHIHRDEYWLVMEGTGMVFLDIRYAEDSRPEPVGHPIKEFSQIPVSRGSNLFIPKKAIHQLTNTGTKSLIVLETQVGAICEEDDIMRVSY